MTRLKSGNLEFNISKESEKQLEEQKSSKTEKEVNFSYVNTAVTFQKEDTSSSKKDIATIKEASSAAVLDARTQKGNLTAAIGVKYSDTSSSTEKASRALEKASATITTRGATQLQPVLPKQETAKSTTRSTPGFVTRIETPPQATAPEKEVVVRSNFDVPQVFIKSIFLDEEHGQKTSRIKFALKIPYDEKNKQILETYDENLSINIIQVKDAKLYSFLNISKELLWYVVNPEKLTTLPQIILNISRNIGLTKTATISEIKKIFKDTKYVNLKTIKPKNALAIARLEKDVRENTTLNLQYESKFKNEIRIEHLSYFTYVDLDKDELIDKNINESFDMSNIRVSSEVVISNNKIVTQTYAYYLIDPITKNKILWTDFKHLDPEKGQWYTGKITDNEERKKLLVREIFFNTKIKDLTVFSTIEKNIGKQEPANNLAITTTISPIRMMGVEEEAIMFNINTELLLEKYSPLYSHISSLNLANSNIIKSVTVFKKRVRVESRTNYVKEFSANQPTVYLSNPIIEIDNNGPINKISVRDGSVRQGKYCYGLEVTFSDVIKQDLEVYLQSLNNTKKYLLRYYTEATINRKYYDVESGQFTDSFYEKNKENTQLAESLTIFLESYAKVIIGSTVPNTTKEQILVQISPKTGNTESVLRFIQTVDHLIKYYVDTLKKASNIAVYSEEKYFNSFEQVIEFKPEPNVSFGTPNSFLFGSFFDKNNLIIEKKQQNLYIPIESNDTWKNINNQDKYYMREWIMSTNFILNKYESVSQEDKYEKAIAALGETESPIIEEVVERYAAQRPVAVELFSTLPKANVQIIQEDIKNIHSSINLAPREYASNNIVADLKIPEVMNSVSTKKRGTFR